MEQLFLEEHEQFSQRATLFVSTRIFLASEMIFFISGQLSMPGTNDRNIINIELIP
jgi:hypothetical protein